MEPQFDLLDHFQSPYPVAIVKRDGKYGLIHRSGKILLPPEYTSVPYVGADKPNKIEKNRLWGFIDTGGQIIAPPQFESIEQLVHPVRWLESMEYVLNQAEFLFFECGPGSALSNMVGRIREQKDRGNSIP